MGSKQPERRLRALLRAPEAGEYNLAGFVAAHGAELGLDQSSVREPDDVLAPKLRAVLDERGRQNEQLVETATLVTARQVSRTARWQGDSLHLQPDLFFRLTKLSSKRKFIRLSSKHIDVTIRRHALARAGTAVRAFRDVSVYVDASGLHIRWAPCGRLNFYPQSVSARDATVVIALPARSVTTTLPALLGDVLAEMGFGA